MADPVAEKVDYLSMSDEDMANMPSPPLEMVEEVQEPVVDEAPVVEKPVEAPEAGEVDAEQASDEAGEGAETEVEKEEKPVTPENLGDEKPPAEKPEGEKEDKPKEQAAVDFEAEYKRLLAPFKANGRDISVGSVDDAIVLMQMGANYNKKMAGLKPNLKLMKLLENNGLLSEEKISFLVELDKKNPDAINKLVKDSGLNPMDFDAEKAGEYKPKIHTVDEREIELDTVLDEIQDTPTYNRTLKIVSKEWDGASKQVVAGSPQLLKVINTHIESGIYDLISAEVERERVFGRLNGLSDIEAYRQVGDAIQARGGFNHLGSSQKATPPKPVVVQPKPKQVDSDELKEKRRAASSTKPATPVSAPAKEFNPLSMSDAEFLKLAESKYR